MVTRDEIFEGTLDGASSNEIENAFDVAVRIFRRDEAWSRELDGIEG